jgi:hypothetical protein
MTLTTQDIAREYFRVALERTTIELTDDERRACITDLVDMFEGENWENLRECFAEWCRRISPAEIRSYAGVLLASSARKAGAR